MKMRALLNLFEDLSPSNNQIDAFKSVIAAKIKELPDDDATAKTLKEIEELLKHIHAGGFRQMVYGQLEEINDPAVMASQKRLAQYILNINSTPAEREELFRMWKANKIVNIGMLLSKKRYTFADIFNGYTTNSMIKELVDDIMEEQQLGQGKGEFGLNVLSKSISVAKTEGNDSKKGDLVVYTGGQWIKVEVKTTQGGAARFADQEVRPAEGYENAAIAINNFVKNKHGERSNVYPIQQLYPKGYPTAGLNLNKAIELYKNIPSKDQTTLTGLLTSVITLIFGGKKTPSVAKIIKAIQTGNSTAGLQAYSQASFNYYMDSKDDDGVLAIDLNRKDFMYFRTAEELTNEKLRFHANTFYLSTIKDPGRSVYPQLEVVPTTFGANARAAADKKAAAEKEKWTKAKPDAPVKKPRISRDEFLKSCWDFAKDLSARRGVNNQVGIEQIYNVVAREALRGSDNKKIYAILVKQFPELKVPVSTKPVAPAPVAPAPVAPAPDAPPAPETVPPAQPVRERRANFESFRQRR